MRRDGFVSSTFHMRKLSLTTQLAHYYSTNQSRSSQSKPMVFPLEPSTINKLLAVLICNKVLCMHHQIPSMKTIISPILQMRKLNSHLIKSLIQVTQLKIREGGIQTWVCVTGCPIQLPHHGKVDSMPGGQGKLPPLLEMIQIHAKEFDAFPMSPSQKV